MIVMIALITQIKFQTMKEHLERGDAGEHNHNVENVKILIKDLNKEKNYEKFEEVQCHVISSVFIGDGALKWGYGG
jgi:ADP-glucose pyrophosphorylase